MARVKIKVRKQQELDPGSAVRESEMPVYRGPKNIQQPDVARMKRDAFRRKNPHTSV